MNSSDFASCVSIKGARVHNLKNVSVDIPRNKLIVITGLSGSGKSSLAFDTLYAEGQRRYVESLSSYARQFLGRINKPEVDSITGIPPAIAIEQKVISQNPRSTVGTTTEIYEYLKLLFARIGRTYSPISGIEVKSHSVTDVVNYISSCPAGTKQLILSPISGSGKTNPENILQSLSQEGFTRIEVNNRIFRIDSEEWRHLLSISDANLRLVIDRYGVSHDEDFLSRCADSVQTAFAKGNGSCIIVSETDAGTIESEFSCSFSADGLQFELPSVHLFSFNTPLGACPQCEGYGKVIGIDENLVIPDQSLSVFQDAVACWKGESMSNYKNYFLEHAAHWKFPIHRPYFQLTAEERDVLWNGRTGFMGIRPFFEYLEQHKYKIQNRIMLSRYMGKTTCSECNGSRLRKEALYVKVCGKTISDLVAIPISELEAIFNSFCLNEYEEKLARRVLLEIRNRLSFLNNVGLGYLTLNRLSNTLSGGESQRINLATSLGSSLVGSLYILDEPSIGLHPRDTSRLIGVLKSLRDLGNTVVVVEHDEEIIRAADHIIDIGPLAGRKGGEIVFSGSLTQLLKNETSLTARYLNKLESIPVPPNRRKWSNYVKISGARENNLKNIDVKIPLNCMVAVTGVSGSGKSSLIRRILYPAVARHLIGAGEKPGLFNKLEGDLHLLKGIEMVDQNPIGRSSRSNPVTYIKAYDEIRKMLSELPYAARMNFKPSHFSFNIAGGRCEECQGEGFIKVEMQFMADVTLVCESCKGKRFKDDVLEVKYRNRNVYDILEMTVNQAIEFFEEEKNTTNNRIVNRLKPLQDVGLGYIKLGQSSSTLSGGESQRVKLAYYLQKDQATQPHLFVFDEPTTGLHFHDTHRLLDAFHSLIRKGHSLVVIEHNAEVIKCADWVIDLGPDGGNEGGNLVFEGTPEELINFKGSVTGRHLKERF